MPAAPERRRNRSNLVRIALAAALALLTFLAIAAPALAVKPKKKPPSLASTAQYKAFVEYVKKLDGMVGAPTAAAQKTTYETELSAKKEAAAHKANALFNRQSDEAEKAANEEAKGQSEAVRAKEGEELEALEAEYAAKVKKATTSYHAKVERLFTGHENFEKRVNEQIAALRAQKAATKDVGGKNAIQERITQKINEIREKRREESEKRATLKTGYREQKEELHAAEAKKETEIGEAAEATVEKIAKHWKHVFTEKKAKLNSKREAQLAYLNVKLEKGRADIASMPAA